MKTDHLLNATIGLEVIRVWHKTQMVSLTDLFRAGNAYRVLNGVNPANQNLFVNSVSTQEFIRVITKRLGVANDAVYKRIGKGKNSETFVSLHLAVYAAEYLSPEFHFEVIDAFINGKLCEYRDLGGDAFKDLNSVVSASAIHVLGRPSHNGHYITLAKIIKSRVNPDGDEWDSATALQLKYRYEIERDLCKFLAMGVVRDWEHLKELAEKV